MPVHQPRRSGATIGTRVLFIALVPSLAVLVVGAALSTYLVRQGLAANGFAQDVRGALDPISRFVTDTQEERRLTMLRGAAPGAADAALTGQDQLDTARRRVDDSLAALSGTADRLADGAPDGLRRSLTFLTESGHGLPAIRQQIDTGVLDAWRAYHVYNDLLDQCGAVIQGIARSAADAEVGFEQMISYDLFKSAEAMSRSHAMAVRAVASGLDGTQFHELAHQLGMYHEQIESVVPRMTEQERSGYAALKQTLWWTTLVAGDNSLMNRGPSTAPANFDVVQWESAARQVGDGLMRLYVSHSRYGANLATDKGSATLRTSITAGAAILVFGVLSILVALRLSRKLVRRLRELRGETLDVAHHELPRMVATIRSGNRIDLDRQMRHLDYGGDEVGQVADAFNTAQRTAVAAAVREAETRQGVRSVFLNIARRSQVIVHRQLQVLDEAERTVDDPEHLRTLFQLDHLATRGRRNAENLIILAGEQPGRQWRHPIPLRDVVRSAVAETEQYTRVQVTSLPEVSVAGAAVADIVHLIAELVDNGAAFSPRESTVEVRGNRAGRGVLVQVEDQGLGIEEPALTEINQMLHEPPDFNVMALSAESRVGLFVVARLAARHGIKVSLRESDFGGTCAVVLIPADRIADGADSAGPSAEPPPGGVRMIGGRPPLPRRERQTNLAAQLVSGLPAEETGPVHPEDERLRSERRRKTMTAFQQGTRQGRGGSQTGQWPDPNRRGV
ncbi:nitrate- and nitrite sensing domain-containing protein [Actinophytocola sp.]|uniref:sensor histidine kinase n=1 Tax=Actinophytocola sp. TaxID=1872138 RepID=UPI002D7E17B9|nr:nitrate- and nitrite sensing domain-containing protein [Actinophytocola sp.]HET9142366.1 nitrate- and nitrite sensing domain-containing protein [Actinophytocola sp.]